LSQLEMPRRADSVFLARFLLIKYFVNLGILRAFFWTFVTSCCTL